MTAVPETPPGAISDGARKTVSDTTINSVPAVISRKDCGAPFQFAREDLFNDVILPCLSPHNNAGPFGYAQGRR